MSLRRKIPLGLRSSDQKPSQLTSSWLPSSTMTPPLMTMICRGRCRLQVSIRRSECQRPRKAGKQQGAATLSQPLIVDRRCATKMLVRPSAKLCKSSPCVAPRL